MSTLPDVRRHPQTGSPFDTLRQHRPDGSEFWSARDLMPLLGYGQWARLENPIRRAMISAGNTGCDVRREFVQVAQLAGAGNLGAQQRIDYHLGREAAYLVAMNCDVRKPEVAAAQAYFVVRTRQAELAVPAQSGLSRLDTLQVMLDQLREQEVRQQQLELSTRTVTARVDAIEGHYDEFAALGYAKLHKLPTDRPYLIRLGKAATAAMRQLGEEPRKRQDATFGQINVYPVWALDEAVLKLEGSA